MDKTINISLGGFAFNIDDAAYNVLRKYLSDISFSSNDYTLNTLLTLIPKKIHIHLITPHIDEFITTLKAIFEDKIIICTDCNICNLYKKNQKNPSIII